MTMKKLYSPFILCLSIILFTANADLRAQNLVPNGDFEAQDTCPAVSQIELAQPWNSPTIGSPDLFNNTCPSQNGSANSGIGCSGIYTYSTFADNREYVQVQLTSPLVAGTTYDVTFFCKRLDWFTYATDRIGAYFSNAEMDITTTGVLPETPQVENPAGAVLTSSSYNMISGSFVAVGGEEYMVIGNFKDDANTITQDVENNGNLKAYYYLDDITVIAQGGGGPGPTAIDEADKKIGLNIYPNPSEGIVNIELSNSSGANLSYGITDINGRLVNHELLGSDMQQSLDLSFLDKGMYMIQIYSEGDRVAYQKVVLR